MSSWCSVKVTEQDGVTVASLAGELDLGSAPSAFERIAVADGDGLVVIDLTGVPFIDSVGVGQIIHLARRASVRLVIAAGSMPERVMKITGLLEAIPCFGSVDDAVRS
jgi:anti-sigma B factor antagonist